MGKTWKKFGNKGRKYYDEEGYVEKNPSKKDKQNSKDLRQDRNRRRNSFENNSDEDG